MHTEHQTHPSHGLHQYKPGTSLHFFPAFPTSPFGHSSVIFLQFSTSSMALNLHLFQPRCSPSTRSSHHQNPKHRLSTPLLQPAGTHIDTFVPYRHTSMAAFSDVTNTTPLITDNVCYHLLLPTPETPYAISALLVQEDTHVEER